MDCPGREYPAGAHRRRTPLTLKHVSVMFACRNQRDERTEKESMLRSAHTSFIGFTAFIGVFPDGGVSVCS